MWLELLFALLFAFAVAEIVPILQAFDDEDSDNDPRHTNAARGSGALVAMLNGVFLNGSGFVSRTSGDDTAISSSGKDVIKSGRGDQNPNGGKGFDRVMSEEAPFRRGKGCA